MAIKMRVIGGKWSVKMAPENGGTGTTLARSTVLWVPLERILADAPEQMGNMSHCTTM